MIVDPVPQPQTTGTRSRLLPEMWALHRLAKELGKATHVLVSAAARGEFPAVVKVGGLWFVKADDVREWFARNHAVDVSTASRERVAEAGRGQP